MHIFTGVGNADVYIIVKLVFKSLEYTFIELVPVYLTSLTKIWLLFSPLSIPDLSLDQSLKPGSASSNNVFVLLILYILFIVEEITVLWFSK